MDIREYKDEAKKRIESGKMSEKEWDEITTAILYMSENAGLPNFDFHVNRNEVFERR